MVESFVPIAHYHDEAMDICNFYPDTDTGKKKQITEQEVQGYYGVGIVCAFIKGVEPDVYEMAKHLQVPLDVLTKPLDCLRVNGLLGNKTSIKRDNVLKARSHNCHTRWITENHMTRVAWCLIAGYASGFTGLRN